jgi:hypothetical protein
MLDRAKLSDRDTAENELYSEGIKTLGGGKKFDPAAVGYTPIIKRAVAAQNRTTAEKVARQHFTKTMKEAESWLIATVPTPEIAEPAVDMKARAQDRYDEYAAFAVSAITLRCKLRSSSWI